LAGLGHTGTRSYRDRQFLVAAIVNPSEFPHRSYRHKIYSHTRAQRSRMILKRLLRCDDALYALFAHLLRPCYLFLCRSGPGILASVVHVKDMCRLPELSFELDRKVLACQLADESLTLFHDREEISTALWMSLSNCLNASCAAAQINQDVFLNAALHKRGFTNAMYAN
jgi:hypothetical protein